MLRIKMVGRETVFERHVNKRDVKQACAEHLMYWGRESVPNGRKDHQGKDIYEKRDIPASEFLFEWVTNPNTPDETVEVITLG